MAYAGYLLKLKKPDNSYIDFPLDYISAESYKVTPNQRMESSASRSTTGLLTRTTCEHTASKIEFNTIPGDNFMVAKINALLSGCFTNATQRNISIQYYDPETDTYKTADCYMPDVDYDILRIDATHVFYSNLRYAFIEY